MRTAFTLLLFASVGIAGQPDAPTVKPTGFSFKKEAAALGEVALELSKSPAGVAVNVDPRALKAKCTGGFENTPFWEALETAADQTKTRLAIRESGRAVVLEPRLKNREISAISGPFRIVPRNVIGKLSLDDGSVSHEVQLDVHWEPRMPVYRIDNYPSITKAEDDRGTSLVPRPASARHYPTGAITDMTVQLTGLTRDSKRIGTLSGEFRATVAAKLLAVRFADLGGKFPITQTEDGVKLTLKSFEKTNNTWDAELLLEYPTNHPSFESFEEQKWLRDNRLTLIGPGAKPLEADSEDVNAGGRFVSATYRFKVAGNPVTKGWSLVCETPGPLMEVKVPFTLKNIPIP
jgi:hypothetical protein